MAHGGGPSAPPAPQRRARQLLAALGATRFVRFAATRGLQVRGPVAERLVDAARNALPMPDAGVARRVLAADLELLADLAAQVTAAEVEMAALPPRSPFATLTTVPGWGVVRAGNYGAAVGDPHRWPGFRQIYRASGLSPVQYESAGRRRDGSISREGEAEERNPAYKERMIREGVAHAALVFSEDEAVAWAEYGTPEELPSIHHRKQYDEGMVTPPDYRITCIYVDKRHRRAGLAAVALRGALDLIARAGGGLVEGYPQDTPGKKMNPSFLYNGTRHLYEEAGFTYDRPKGKNHCVMTMTVESTS